MTKRFLFGMMVVGLASLAQGSAEPPVLKPYCRVVSTPNTCIPGGNISLQCADNTDTTCSSTPNLALCGDTEEQNVWGAQCQVFLTPDCTGAAQPTVTQITVMICNTGNP